MDLLTWADLRRKKIELCSFDEREDTEDKKSAPNMRWMKSKRAKVKRERKENKSDHEFPLQICKRAMMSSRSWYFPFELPLRTMAIITVFNNFNFSLALARHRSAIIIIIIIVAAAAWTQRANHRQFDKLRREIKPTKTKDEKSLHMLFSSFATVCVCLLFVFIVRVRASKTKKK